MSDFMQTIYDILPYFWIAVFAALAVLSFLRLRMTAGGIILGTGFAVHALVTIVRLLIQGLVFSRPVPDSNAHVAFILVSFYIIPILIQIYITIGIALIPRSLRQLARPAGARA
jgi:hypothetical protein